MIELAVHGGGTLLLRLPRVALVTTSRDVNYEKKFNI